MRSFTQAKNMIKRGLHGDNVRRTGSGTTDDHYKHLVCSYAYIKRRGWGHTVWCFDRSELGEGARMMSYRRGAFFSGGYML